MSSTFHRCAQCGYVTDLSHFLPAFEDNPHCRQCGLSATEGDAKMQDELVALMSRNMHLSAVQPPGQEASAPPIPQVVPQPAPIAYITQHYHHSAHVASTQVQELQVSTILENAGVNPQALLPSQLQLFRNAEPDQKQRLVELWRISPPTFGNQMPARYMNNWPQTSMDIEEEAARERWEKKELEKEQLSNIGAISQNTAEPYMAQGYANHQSQNDLMTDTNDSIHTSRATDYKQSSDPVYQGREWWNLSAAERMEHQYGMIQQMQMQMHNIG